MGFVELEPCNGPPCPRCGCRDVQVSVWPPELGPGDKPSWYGQGRARCRHCGMPFTFRERPSNNYADFPGPGDIDDYVGGEFEPADPEVIGYDTKQAEKQDLAYPVRVCPKCGSPEIKVYRTLAEKPNIPRIRYHRCLDCKIRFKSHDSRHIKRPLRIVS